MGEGALKRGNQLREFDKCDYLLQVAMNVWIILQTVHMYIE